MCACVHVCVSACIHICVSEWVWCMCDEFGVCICMHAWISGTLSTPTVVALEQAGERVINASCTLYSAQACPSMGLQQPQLTVAGLRASKSFSVYRRNALPGPSRPAATGQQSAWATATAVAPDGRCTICLPAHFLPAASEQGAAQCGLFLPPLHGFCWHMRKCNLLRLHRDLCACPLPYLHARSAAALAPVTQAPPAGERRVRKAKMGNLPANLPAATC